MGKRYGHKLPTRWGTGPQKRGERPAEMAQGPQGLTTMAQDQFQ